MYGRVTGTGASRSPPLHSSVREVYSSFRFAVVIHAYVREKNAAMIYWLHQQKIWDYLLDCDEDIIKQEMNNLIQQIKAGRISVSRRVMLSMSRGHCCILLSLKSRMCNARPISWLLKRAH